MVHAGDIVRAHLCIGGSRISGAGLPYLCSSCPSFGSGYLIPLHVGDWLLAHLNIFPAGGELFPCFLNTGVSIRLTYLAGLYTVLPCFSSRMVGTGWYGSV